MSIVRADKGIENPEITETIVRFIKQGASEGSAVAMAGIHPGTYARWMNKGANDPEVRGPYGRFYIEVQRAKAIAEYASLSVILSSPDWHAHQFIISTRNHENWSPRVKDARALPPSAEDIEALRAIPEEELERMLKQGDMKALAEERIIEVDEDDGE